MAAALGVTGANALIQFDTATPGTVTSSTAITGLVGGETIEGIDFRAATGQLFALSSGGRLYTIDPTTAVATQVGSDGAFTLSGAEFGIDFNPVPDRIRVVSDLDQNLRLNPNDGTLTLADGALAYAIGDANVGANPNIVAAAYTNSFVGATATTLYGIDSNLDILVTQAPPNAGTLNTVGALGINVTDVAGFDIQPSGNTAFATLTTNGTTSALYSINLATGAATLVGNIGAAPTLVRGLAIVPAGTLQLSSTLFAASESGPTATITINRLGGSEGTVTAILSTSDGTATSPLDFIDTDVVVTFAPGVTTQTVTIPIVGDTFIEADETVNLTLTSPTGGAVLGVQAAGVLGITNDDAPGAPTLSISDVAVLEGNGGPGSTTATFTISLSAANSQPVTVVVTTSDGTATSGVDYTPAAQLVTFAPGETSQTVNVLINGDLLVEANETFFVNLTAAVNAGFSDAQGLGTIVNDDAPLVIPAPTLSISDVAVLEGDTGATNAVFTITLSEASLLPVTVLASSADGSATVAGLDYVLLPPTLVTFLPGDPLTQTVTVTVNGDVVVELNETFSVNLSAATNAT
ncbi:MAG: DUF4394 domain-containing protein, partial [Planctomycetaceae bacterium]|nr:DUF4394 domain-containing protein [Planctomycetaceae bacterium]